LFTFQSYLFYTLQSLLLSIFKGELLGVPLPPLIKIAKHRFAKKFLLRLLSPTKSHLEPDELPLFTQQSLSSKKPAPARRKEHLAYLKNPLLYLCHKHLSDLVRCKTGGGKILEEVRGCFQLQVVGVL